MQRYLYAFMLTERWSEDELRVDVQLSVARRRRSQYGSLLHNLSSSEWVEGWSKDS